MRREGSSSFLGSADESMVIFVCICARGGDSCVLCCVVVLWFGCYITAFRLQCFP